MIQGFAEDFVDSLVYALFNILLLGVASHRTNNGLLHILLEQVLPDQVGGCASIHDGHVDVHEDDAVAAFVVLEDIIGYHGNGLFAVVGGVTYFVNISDSCRLKDNLK